MIWAAATARPGFGRYFPLRAADGLPFVGGGDITYPTAGGVGDSLKVTVSDASFGQAYYTGYGLLRMA